MNLLSPQYTAASCTCDACVNACRRYPGWMTPEEAGDAISAGIASKLALDWFEPSKDLGNRKRIFVLAPAPRGRGGRLFPEIHEMKGYEPGIRGMLNLMSGIKPYPGACVLLKKGLCSIHSSGFKPTECRAALACGKDDGGPSKPDIAKMWRTKRARAVVARWKKLVSFKETTS